MGDAARPKRRRPKDRREQILVEAEDLARLNGYHGFSFRDVATRVGVKSASVHHHFPTKSDLTSALVARYRTRFLDTLGPADEPGAALRLMSAYRDAMVVDDRMSLCGLFGAEIDSVPEALGDEVRRFFAGITAWAATAIGDAGNPPDRAETLVAGLEGAMIVARAGRDPAAFDRIAGRLLADHR